jgi:hypothetical protein
MADAYQTRAQLVTDFADNTSGVITAQLLRDLLYSTVILNSAGLVDVGAAPVFKLPCSLDLNGQSVLNGATVSFDSAHLTSDGSGNLTAISFVGKFPLPTGVSRVTGVNKGVLLGDFNWKGPWLVGTAYVANDVVNDAAGTGLWYYCITAHTGHEPPNATYWASMPTNAGELIYYGPGAFDAAGSVTMDTLRFNNVTGQTNMAGAGADVFSTDGITQCNNSVSFNTSDIVDADESFSICGGTVTGAAPGSHASHCFAMGQTVNVTGTLLNSNAIGQNITNSTTQTTQIGYSDATKVKIDVNGLRAIGLQAYAAGTAYTVTNASAAVVFGTTSPTLTLATAGKYSLRGSFQVDLSGATFAATRTLTVKIRRTNNTAADLANSTRTLVVPIVTTTSETLGIYEIPEILYTAAAGDIISLFAGIDVAPSAGALNFVAANLIATTIQ